MLRTINFIGRTGRYDVPSFLWLENEELTIQINVETYMQGRFVCVVKHGNAKKTVCLNEDNTFTLPANWLKENGTLPVEILLELRTTDLSRVIIPNGRENGGYFIEPLQIDYVDDTYTAIGWLTKIENGILSHTQEIEELQSMVAGLHDKIEKAKNEAIVAATGGDLMNG